jgi:BCD family chlorophyll transporter-like MFS transporter
MKADFGWPAILRLGLVQASLGSVVVMTTSTLNRVMVVELELPALLPGCLVALHYLVQVLRPRMGHGSDSGRRRTPWIVGGMALLAAGGVGAAAATALMTTHPLAGIVAAVLAFSVLGIGVSAAGTSLLVLLAQRVQASQRASAATVVWIR